MDKYAEYRFQLKQKGLKVTPQRVSVLAAMNTLDHPTAEQVRDHVRENYPEMATGTVYQTLDAFAASGLIRRVRTDSSVMRYEPLTRAHHHLYCSECDVIADYYDDELNDLLKEYFLNKSISNFSVTEIRLQIAGRFTNEKLDGEGLCVAAKKKKSNQSS